MTATQLRTHLMWPAACAAMLFALLAPALWNGFPLIFSDTGGYLARPFEHTLAIGRSAFYGAFLAAGIPFDFWPNVAIQAAIAVWLCVLTLRVNGLGGRPGLAAAVVGALAACTALPWFASQLMPDVFVPFAVLGLYLLAFRRAGLGRIETIMLVGLIAVAIASHMAILALSLILWGAFAACWLLAPRAWGIGPRPLLPGTAVLVGALLALTSNLAITGQPAFTPGGESFLFGRLLQDGIVARYLDEHCPQASAKLCPLRGELSRVADDWLWANDSVLERVGGWQTFAPEERRIIMETIRLYPGQHAAAALRAIGDQLTALRTTVSVKPWDNDHARSMIERLAPDATARFEAARQQRGQPDIDWINRIHVPLGVGAIAALAIWLAAGGRARAAPSAIWLGLTVLTALVANAAICGIFSNVSDRYQSRLLWLVPLALAIAWLSPRGAAEAEPIRAPAERRDQALRRVPSPLERDGTAGAEGVSAGLSHSRPRPGCAAAR